MQIAYDAGSFPGCEPVFIVVDGKNSSNLRRHDPDSPLTGAKPKPSPRNELDEMERTQIEVEPEPIQIPKLQMHHMFEKEQEKIDNMDDERRCANYGVPLLPEDERHTKRIFFGSMLADENPELIAAHAIEVYNQYHLIALVESNTTHSNDPRKMKYGPGSMDARILTESELFGTTDKTKVVIDYWLEDKPYLYEMSREVEQRNTIWKIWVEQGMTQRDIGLMADLDEVVSRDFLNALQVCDFPKLRFDPSQTGENRPSCQTPKMALAAIQFDGSPLCIKKLEWYHPDLILGNCIAGVGDPTGRVTPVRDISPEGSDQMTEGSRHHGWGKWDYNNYPQDVKDNNRFPLWDGRDIREVMGSTDNLVNRVRRRGMGKNVYGAAYHLHNWFKDTETLRHKFATYGHAEKNARDTPLSDFGDGDINMMVRCARDLGNDIKIRDDKDPNLYEYYLNNTVLPEGINTIFSLGGNRPIYFSNRTYVLERHALLQKMILDDEAKYGTIYDEAAILAFEESKKNQATNE